MTGCEVGVSVDGNQCRHEYQDDGIRRGHSGRAGALATLFYVARKLLQHVY